MLEEQWYAVLRAGDVKARPVAVRRFGRDLVLWRGSDGAVSCAVDACPHRGAALSRGRVVDGCLACPYHGLRFDPQGACVHVPAAPSAPVPGGLDLALLPTVESRGLIWVFHGAGDPPALPWTDAFQDELTADGGAFLDLCDSFDVSYLRVMENLTDFHHVAHVHRYTAPVPAEVTAFSARREGHHVYVQGALGQPGERGHMTATTHIVAPCLAVLSFQGLARFAVVATPIDADHVWLFARYTQTAVHVPGLTRLLTWLLGTFDYALLQRLQDVPVWRSQRLPDPGDIDRYRLLECDEGVRLYFEIHRELRA